jgi:hypothetical protein
VTLAIREEIRVRPVTLLLNGCLSPDRLREEYRGLPTPGDSKFDIGSNLEIIILLAMVLFGCGSPLLLDIIL